MIPITSPFETLKLIPFKTFLLPKTVEVVEKLLHKEKLDDADKNLIKNLFTNYKRH